MPDTYATYAALAAVEVEGVDYLRHAVSPVGSTWAAIAIHGGGIEPGSGTLAKEIAAGSSTWRYYEFDGTKSSGNNVLHITSTNFDEPQCLALLATSTHTVSVHGFTGTPGVAVTAIGGRDTILRDRITAALLGAGFAVTTAPEEINGDDPDNICNRNLRGAGVQLELSQAQRQAFFVGGSTAKSVRDDPSKRTTAFWAYVNAIRSAYIDPVPDRPTTPTPRPRDTVWMIDPAGAKRGTITWTSYRAVPRFNAVSTAEVVCPLNPRHALAAAPGWRLAIVDGTRVTIAGPVVDAEITIDGTGGRARPQLVLRIEDDLRWLAGTQARPAPLAALTAQTPAYDVRTGQASTIMREYVDLNAGPGALTNRRVPGLTLAPDPATGATVTGRARFDRLLDLLAGLGISAGGPGLGFRINAGLSLDKTFEIYSPTDLRGPARFSIALRNLRRLNWRLTAPTATHIIGGGRGEEDAREFIEVADTGAATAWGRVEDFYDYRSASDADSGAELTQGATKRLVEQTETTAVEIEPVDTARLVYGRDYGLGDLVTVDIYGGVTVDEMIREVEITADRTGKRVRPRIGSVGTTRTRRDALLLRDALARLGSVERR
ncbi:Gp37-like protein [Actinokineospora globicatena]|uniref:Gp28/Gp37-like domain-containing protein n=1 Tax=Actinokineospora globicatena TaxID=103729 RepID=A0A9W6QKL7_9PSEU|nr:poly-gamma-glutamate hydrolase family protein [Actinokineospora globicatena]GLW91766.1 hypothetical protein Aglo03_25820 [Actinokineospora globicatena]